MVSATLYVNAGLNADVEVASGASGIGLYRSELPFMLFDRLPSEREQAQLYRTVLQAMHPLASNDPGYIGGDKQLPAFQRGRIPTRGQRGIRFLLDHPDVFLTQLRAVLRANEGWVIYGFLPMITCVDELDQSTAACRPGQTAGRRGSRRTAGNGAMIEVPASDLPDCAAGQEGRLLFVGTNDLAQFLLATDRDDFAGGRVLTCRIRRCCRRFIASLKRRTELGKPVSLWGTQRETAIALVLLGMGSDALSGAAAVARVKAAIRRVNSASFARKFADEALRCQSRTDVERMLRVHAYRRGVGTAWQRGIAIEGKPAQLAGKNRQRYKWR